MKHMLICIIVLQCCLAQYIMAESPAASESSSWARWIPYRHFDVIYSRGLIVQDDGGVTIGNGCWLMRFDAAGSVDWERKYTGLEVRRWHYLQNSKIAPAADGGIIAVGSIKKPNVTGLFDLWIRKFSRDRSRVEDTVLIGGPMDEYAADVCQTEDGGYAIAGRKKASRNEYDIIVIKLSAKSDVQWSRIFSGLNYAIPRSIDSTADGGVIATGYCFSSGWEEQAMMVKLDSHGNLEWGTLLRADAGCGLNGVVQLDDGCYLAGGSMGHLNDSWIVKFDQAGKIIWQKEIGGDGSAANIFGINRLANGNAIVGGYYDQGSGGGSSDAWIAEIDALDGAIIFQRGFTGPKYMSMVDALVEMPDGGFCLTTGYTSLIRLGPGPVLDEPCSPLMLITRAKANRTHARESSLEVTSLDAAVNVRRIGGEAKDARTFCTDYCRFPDLTGSWQWIHPDGKSVDASLSCQNIGTKPTPYEFYIDVYLSSDQVVDDSDLLIEQIHEYELRIGEFIVPARVEYTSAESISGKYLIAVLGDFFDGDARNNSIVGVIP